MGLLIKTNFRLEFKKNKLKNYEKHFKVLGVNN
jgi:hypothetical protein